MIAFIEKHREAAESSRSAASCRSLRRPIMRMPPSPAIPEMPPTGSKGTPNPSRQSGASTMKAEGGKERARSGASCGRRAAGPPDAPWSGSCGSKDCKASCEGARRPRSPIRHGHALGTMPTVSSRPTRPISSGPPTPPACTSQWEWSAPHSSSMSSLGRSSDGAFLP